MIRIHPLVLGAIGSHWFRRKGIATPKRWLLNGWPILDRHRDAAIEFGENVVLTSDPRATALGTAHPVIIRAMSPGATIRIGSDTGMSGTTICAQSMITIGSQCLIGGSVTIVDTDFHPIAAAGRRFAPLSAAATRPVVIGDNVFVGGHSIVLKGVTIGDNSVIGAGSVVATDIPPNCIAAGNPARVLRRLDGAPGKDRS